MKKIAILVTGIVLVCLCGGWPVWAEDYPDRPVKVIIPFKAGGGSDVHARLMQKVIKKNNYLPQPLVVITQPGGGTVIGSTKVKTAKPDGYTVLCNHVSMLTAEAMGVQPFGPDAFEPVAQIETNYICLMAGKNTPYKTLKDMVEDAKKRPREIKVATNLGALVHVVTLAFGDSAGIELKLVHKGGGSKRFAAIMGGHVDLNLSNLGMALPLLESGDVRILGIFADKRFPDTPDIPTVKEQGYNVPSIAVSQWYLMPKGTPKDRIDVLADALEKASNDPEVAEMQKKMAILPNFARGEALVRIIAEQREAIMKIVKKYGLRKKK